MTSLIDLDGNYGQLWNVFGSALCITKSSFRKEKYSPAPQAATSPSRSGRVREVVIKKKLLSFGYFPKEAGSVIESPCPYVCMYVCMSVIKVVIVNNGQSIRFLSFFTQQKSGLVWF